MENALVPMSDIEKMGTAIAKSGLFGMKTPEQAIALMLIAQAENMHPAIAARDYHVIQGRPALKADAMLARFIDHGGKVEWHEYTDNAVIATFSHPAGGSVKIDWTIQRAKDAGLTCKDTWKKYPRQMLRARVISEGIRTVYPGISVGIYTPEECQDMEPSKPVETQAIIVEPPKAELKATPPKPETKLAEPIKPDISTITGNLSTVIQPQPSDKVKVCRIEVDVPMDSSHTERVTLGTYNAELFTELPRYIGCDISIPYTVNIKGNKQFDGFTLVSGEPLPF